MRCFDFPHDSRHRRCELAESETEELVRRLVIFSVALCSFLPAMAWAQPLFPQCPPTGENTGCHFLITVGRGGKVTIEEDTNPPNNGPYDGVEDTLVGIVNNSGCPLGSLPLSSPTDIFGFDGDGPCDVNPSAGNCSSDPSGYGGPGVFFENISPDQTSGTVRFKPPLANGQSTWFGLEEALTVADFQLGVPSCSGSKSIPTLSEWVMILLASMMFLTGVLTLCRRQARAN